MSNKINLMKIYFSLQMRYIIKINSGKNCVRIINPSMKEQIKDRTYLECRNIIIRGLSKLPPWS